MPRRGRRIHTEAEARSTDPKRYAHTLLRGRRIGAVDGGAVDGLQDCIDIREYPFLTGAAPCDILMPDEQPTPSDRRRNARRKPPHNSSVE
jgi:hypothetical protein